MIAIRQPSRSAFSFTLIVIAFCSSAFSNKTPAINELFAGTFIENKGQVLSETDAANCKVFYYYSDHLIDLFITDFGISYQFRSDSVVSMNKNVSNNPRPYNNFDVLRKRYRLDMKLIGASIRQNMITAEGQTIAEYSFYMPHCSNGITGVHGFNTIICKDVYPSIDWKIYLHDGGVKYDFIVHPGGNPKDIRIKYIGESNISLLKDNLIKITTPVGELVEGGLYAYDFKTKKPLGSRFKIVKDEVTIELNKHNSNSTVIIDPPLIWSTFFPGTNNTAQKHMIDITTDSQNNVYVVGEGGGTPVLVNPGNGAYFQPTNVSTELYLAKFNSNGTCIWATCYGGNQPDFAQKIAFSPSGSLYCVGKTTSADFPLFNPGNGGYYYSPIPNGNIAFILKFTSAGIRQWATFFGDSYNYILDVACDRDGNTFITGKTSDGISFPMVDPGNGAYFQSPNTMAPDAFVTMFDSGNVIKWSTALGGSGIDQGNGIFIDAQKKIYLTGRAASTNFPLYDPGNGAYFQPTLSSDDAFVTVFDSSFNMSWSTFYGGIFGDIGYGILVDKQRNIYTIGSTASPDIPRIDPGNGEYFQNLIGGSTDAFILKFDSLFNRRWGTLFGGSSTEEAYELSKDDYDNIFIVGSTGSSDMFLQDPGGNSYFQNTSINGDVFLLQVDPSDMLVWSTYLGGSSWDYSYSIHVGVNHHVYTCGTTYSNTFPKVNPGNGAYFQNNFFTSIDGYVAKFGSAENIPVAAFSFSNLCFLDSVQFADSSQGSPTSWLWNFGDPPSGPNNTSSLQNPTHVFSSSGNFSVTLIITTPLGTDTITQQLTIFSLPAVNAGIDLTICQGDTTSLLASGSGSPVWFPSTGLSNDTIFTPAAFPSSSTQYVLMVKDSNGCQNTDTMNIVVNPIPTASITGLDTICAGDTLLLTASGGGTYQWSTGSTTGSISLNLFTDSLLYVVVTTGGCSDTAAHQVIVNPLPSVQITGQDSICLGSATLLVGISNAGYLWNTGTTTSSINISPSSSSWFWLQATNTCGVDYDSLFIVVLPLPAATASPDTIINKGASVIVSAMGGSSYQWSPPDGLSCTQCQSPTASPTATTMYYVIVSDSYGCMAMDSVLVQVEENEIYIPSAFTPNNDGSNDVLFVRGKGIKEVRFMVFSRIGEKVFDSTSMSDGWNGSYKGQALNNGVFTYVATGIFEDNQSFNIKGEVTLLR